MNDIFAPSLELGFLSIGNAVADAKGIPSQRFRKPIIKCGEYVKDTEDLKFEVTKETLDNWVKTFKQMTANGVKVPIPNTHDGDGDPEKNHGYVKDMFIDGDDLVMVCDIIGQTSIEAAAKSDVSIFSPPSFVDGRGNSYTRPIRHVAMCTNPVIPGLGAWIPIAASMKVRQGMKLNELKTKLGIEDELNDKNAQDVIVAHFTKLVNSVKSITASHKIVKEELTALKKESSKGVEEPSEVLLQLSGDSRRTKLEALVSAGKITPAVRDDLIVVYIEKEALTLSLSQGVAGIKVFDGLIDALAKNDPVILGEKSGAQTDEGPLVLSDEMKKDSTKHPLQIDALRRAKQAADLGASNVATAFA